MYKLNNGMLHDNASIMRDKIILMVRPLESQLSLKMDSTLYIPLYNHIQIRQHENHIYNNMWEGIIISIN